MKLLYILLLVLSTSLSTARAGHPEKNAEGFVTIFDGKDLSSVVTEGNLQIQGDGSLALVPREGESGWKRYHHYLWLKEKYADFTFDFEYKHGPGGN